MHINYEHINRPAAPGVCGGSICMCPECMQDRARAAQVKTSNIDKRIELEALLTIRAGYEAENTHRLSCGHSIAYGADEFTDLAKRIMALKTNPAAESQAA